jgi:hypothetical protein
VKIPADKLGWSLTLGREGLSGLPHHQKPARNGYAEGWSIYPLYPIGVPFFMLAFVHNAFLTGSSGCEHDISTLTGIGISTVVFLTVVVYTLPG